MSSDLHTSAWQGRESLSWGGHPNAAETRATTRSNPPMAQMGKLRVYEAKTAAQPSCCACSRGSEVAGEAREKESKQSVPYAVEGIVIPANGWWGRAEPLCWPVLASSSASLSGGPVAMTKNELRGQPAWELVLQHQPRFVPFPTSHLCCPNF